MGNTEDREIIRGNHIEAGPITIQEMEKVIKNRETIALAELDRGYALIKKYPRTVIFSVRPLHPTDKYYQHAESLARRIVTDLKYAVVTGGGPGIMGSGKNKGAYEAKGNFSRIQYSASERTKNKSVRYRIG